MAIQNDKLISDALKKLTTESMGDNKQDSYTIVLDKYIPLEAYIKTLTNCSHYCIKERNNGKFDIHFYDGKYLKSTSKNCIFKNNAFLIPRNRNKRRCFLFKYIRFSLLN